MEPLPAHLHWEDPQEKFPKQRVKDPDRASDTYKGDCRKCVDTYEMLFSHFFFDSETAFVRPQHTFEVKPPRKMVIKGANFT